MKRFIEEFKKFITRGNVLDMAVGVIVGSSFTAIVNSLSNNILKPFINFLLTLIFGASSLSEVYTFLKIAETENADGTKTIDLANSIYIDWGSFLNAILNFFIVAFVLFCLLKIMNRFLENTNEMQKKSASHRKLHKELKRLGIDHRDESAVKEYLEKQKEAELAALRAAREAEIAERKNNPTDNDLLREIVQILKDK